MTAPVSEPDTVAVPPERMVAPVTVPPACTSRVLPLDTTMPAELWPLATVIVAGATAAAVGAKATPRMIESGAAAISWVKLSAAGSVVAASVSLMP